MPDLAAELRLAAEANRALKRENLKLEQRLALLEARAENAALKHGLDFKVSELGAVSVYGLQALPTTLYKDQWERVALAAPDIERFIRDNDAKLITKAESRTRPRPVRRKKR